MLKQTLRIIIKTLDRSRSSTCLDNHELFVLQVKNKHTKKCCFSNVFIHRMRLEGMKAKTNSAQIDAGVEMINASRRREHNFSRCYFFSARHNLFVSRYTHDECSGFCFLAAAADEMAFNSTKIQASRATAQMRKKSENKFVKCMTGPFNFHHDALFAISCALRVVMLLLFR
jgi:hypothetical protein